MKWLLRLFGLVDPGEEFQRCDYVYGTREAPARGGPGQGVYMISYITPGLSDSPGKLRVFGNMPVEPMSASKLLGDMAATPYYTPKIRRYLDSWGVDLEALEGLPADTIDLPARAPRGWWERNTKLYPWWVVA